MSAKDNIRSFRYSDEVAAIIAQQEGKSENDKFEQLVLRCNLILPDIDKKLADRQAMLADKLSKLYELERISDAVRTAHVQADSCISTLNRLASQLHEIEERFSAL